MIKFKVDDIIFAPKGHIIDGDQFCNPEHRFKILEIRDLYYLEVIEKEIVLSEFRYRIGQSFYLQDNVILENFEFVDSIQVTKLKSRFELIDL